MSTTQVVNPRLSSIVVGKFGENQMVKGWHEREVDGRSGIPYRASGGESVFYLKHPPLATKLYLLLSAPVGLRSTPLDGRIVIDKLKYQLPLAVDGWVLRTFPIECAKQAIRIKLMISDPVVPDTVLHNGDARALGWFLSAVWQE
ncbi:hypothetical protein IT571_06610 [Candidatus Sumerlaeota bacterium]|nr:hypothetical protein [Candidatus Sumerlaeota bacterium]